MLIQKTKRDKNKILTELIFCSRIVKLWSMALKISFNWENFVLGTGDGSFILSHYDSYELDKRIC